MALPVNCSVAMRGISIEALKIQMTLLEKGGETGDLNFIYLCRHEN